MDTVLAFIGIAAASGTVLAYLIVIWWLDRYEREPWWLTALAFIWGAVGGTTLAIAWSMPPTAMAISVFGDAIGEQLSIVVVAPVVEELTKALIFLLLILTRHIDNETDGLVYGAATGLGFACVENVIYFSSIGPESSLLMLIVLRTFFSALVHCIASSVLGMMIGRTRHRRGTRLRGLVIGYVLAVIVHAAWNGMAVMASTMTGATGGTLMLIACGLVLAAGVTMFVLTQRSLHREHSALRTYLRREADAGRLPAKHVDIIPYWWRRRRPDWLDASISRRAYVRAATLLAFRQRQRDLNDDDRRSRYDRDIIRLRAEVAELLHSHEGRSWT